MDNYWGYWQVHMHEKSRDKTAFFIPMGKKHWKRMPMGILNAHACYCAMMDHIKKEYTDKFRAKYGDKYQVFFDFMLRQSDKPGADSEIIVDDLFLHSDNEECLLALFIELLKVFQHYCVTINLKKCRFFPLKAKFVGVDVTADGNQPASSKYKAVRDLKHKHPTDPAQLRKIIGFFGFYQEWIPFYEVKISRWRDYLKKVDSIGPDGEPLTVFKMWHQDDTNLLEELTEAILDGPTLKRPDYTRRFYIKTDWSKFGSGMVVLQADPNDPEALAAEKDEENGGPCVFDKTSTKTQFRLLPIAFYSWRSSKAEESWHSFQGEVSVAVKGFQKGKMYLLGRQFTWMTDCRGVKWFFESEYDFAHVFNRWKQILFRFHFTIVHRPERMMTEVDLLSRYNSFAEASRPVSDVPDEATAFVKLAVPTDSTFAYYPIEEVGTGPERTPMSTIVGQSRTVWNIEAAFSSLDAAKSILPFALQILV